MSPWPEIFMIHGVKHWGDNSMKILYLLGLRFPSQLVTLVTHEPHAVGQKTQANAASNLPKEERFVWMWTTKICNKCEGIVNLQYIEYWYHDGASCYCLNHSLMYYSSHKKLQLVSAIIMCRSNNLFVVTQPFLGLWPGIAKIWRRIRGLGPVSIIES